MFSTLFLSILSIASAASLRSANNDDDAYYNADASVDHARLKDDIHPVVATAAAAAADDHSNVATSDGKDVISGNGGGGGRVRRGIINTLTRLHTVGTLLSAAGQHSTGGGGVGSMANLLFADNSEASAAAAESNKKKPYHFNEIELTAIQALVSIRDVIGELLHRVGINIPTFTSLVNRSEGDKLKTSSVPAFLLSGAGGGSTSPLLALKSSNAASLLRGLALSLPLLIPMANQLRRMSVDNAPVAAVAPLRNPFPVSSQMLFDPYYNQALHRRRSRRSATSTILPARRPLSDSSLDYIVTALERFERLYNNSQQH